MALTLQNMMDEVWEMLGEPTDLDPATVAGAAKLTRWLNMAQKRIAGYKFPDGRLVRFPVLYTHTFFTSVFGSFTALAGSTTTQVLITGSGVPGINDWYNNSVVSVGGEYVICVDYAPGVLTIAPALASAPVVGSAVKVYKISYEFLPPTNPLSPANIPISPSGSFMDMLRVEDISNMTVLEQEGRTEDFMGSRNQIGVPSAWRKYGNQIWFDVAPDDAYTYKVDYYRSPADMAITTDVPEIPEDWHDGMVLWARWWGYARGQETGMSYSSKKDFQEFMQLTRQSLEMSFEIIDGAIEVER